MLFEVVDDEDGDVDDGGLVVDESPPKASENGFVSKNDIEGAFA